MGREVLATKEIRESDERGRHTTTHRQLLLLPDGGVVIDTPGMRELHLYGVKPGKVFEDINELALNCRYKDCTHTTEPGCAVRKAMRKTSFLRSASKITSSFSARSLMMASIHASWKMKRSTGCSEARVKMKRLMREVKEKRKGDRGISPAGLNGCFTIF